jgi:hypothetical protein
VLAEALDEQHNGEDRTGEIAEARNQRQDRIDPEADVGARDAEARVE